MRRATVVFQPTSERPLCLRLSEAQLAELVEDLTLMLEEFTHLQTSGELKVLGTVEHPLTPYQDAPAAY